MGQGAEESHSYVVLTGVAPHLALDMGLSFGIRYRVKIRQQQLPVPTYPSSSLLLLSLIFPLLVFRQDAKDLLFPAS